MTARRAMHGLLLLGIGLAVWCVVAIAALEIAARTMPQPSREKLADVSAVVLDAHGGILRAYLAGDGRWRLPASRANVPPAYLGMLIAYEDKRFWQHGGIDALALGRAALQWLRAGRVVSGGSTLTMQVARLLDPRPRGLMSKVRQLITARQLELRFSKAEILGMYLTLAPFGGNVEGLRAAALAYFRREPNQLNMRELALMIALPQAPERRRPDRQSLAAQAAADGVLARLHQRRTLDSAVLARASRMPLAPLPRDNLGFGAAHVAEHLRRGEPNARVIASLIEPSIQRLAEATVTSAGAQWPQSVSAAVVVARNRDGAIVGYVGGSDFRSEIKSGFVDLAQAVRSPGSTLKPFIYGLGFEQRLIHPETIITDAPVNFGTYEPQNFSTGYEGDMTIRDALVKSINTGAMAVLRRVKPARLMARLRASGVPLHLEQSDADAGLAIGLGGAGIKLVELTRAYTGLANGGLIRPLRFKPTDPVATATPLLESDAAWAITDILADMPPPKGFIRLAAADGGRRLAYKTGTSYGFRDAWAVGYDSIHTVGVWVGRADGVPHLDAYGISAAAPLLFRIFEDLPRPPRDVAGEPASGSILAQRHDLPDRLARFGSGAITAKSQQAFAVAFPQPETAIQASSSHTGLVPIPLVVRGGRAPFDWYVDGVAIATASPDSQVNWTPVGTGAARLVVIDAAGARDEVRFWVDAPAQTADLAQASLAGKR